MIGVTRAYMLASTTKMKTVHGNSWTSCAGLLAILWSGAAAYAQSFDNSGNGTLKGDYFVRQVLAVADTSTSAITRGESLTGIMTFDGNGNYSFTGQLVDTQAGSSSKAYTTTGMYEVASNGLLRIQNPIDSTDTEYGGVGAIGPNAIVASATEGKYDDIFIGIPAGSGATNGSVQGTYQVGFIDFLNANAGQVRDGYFTLTSNGSGSFGNVSVKGAMANQNNANVTQSLSGVTYSVSSANGAGTITFPTASNALNTLVSGQKTMYVSSDGNLLLGGASSGFDIFVGVKATSGANNGMFSGTYYTAALENDTSGFCGQANCIDSFYGSTNATGQGVDISHLRLVSFANGAFDYTTDGSYNFGSDGTYSAPSGFQFLLGANGQAVLEVGSSTTYSFTVGFHARNYTGTGVFLNPIGITNAASFAPITNSVAPGELVSLFGSGMGPSTGVLPSSAPSASTPLPTTLSNVQVTVNGVAAPLAYVSASQINLVMPWETPAGGYATFQVTYNGAKSNQVTVYTAPTSPGVFTSQYGVGPAAVTHANGTLVTSSSPAAVGETLVLYVTGLGATTPAATNGVPGLGAPPYSVVSDQNVAVDILDSTGNDVGANTTSTIAVLTPQYPGEYQINFVVPSGLASGAGYINVNTTDGYTTQALIYIK